jgi:hypothetical protein
MSNIIGASAISSTAAISKQQDAAISQQDEKDFLQKLQQEIDTRDKDAQLTASILASTQAGQTGNMAAPISPVATTSAAVPQAANVSVVTKEAQAISAAGSMTSMIEKGLDKKDNAGFSQGVNEATLDMI